MQLVAIVWSCLLLTFVFAADLHAAGSYTIIATAGSGGAISPSGSLVVKNGANQTFAITPNAGHYIASVLVDNVPQWGPPTSYTFINVRANHTISATYGTNTYTITATAGSGGTITPSSASVTYGGSQTFTIAPNTGYAIVDVTVDGVSKGAITTYPFTNVTATHTIAATFVVTYTITATAGSGGTITPSSATVNSGDSQTFTITPNTGYAIANVTVDGVSKGAITTYTFTNVTATHTIAATFGTPSIINATAGSGGTVTPATATVNPGGSQTFTITPNTGYHVANVTVDGFSHGSITSYTFANVTANHTITAIFANTYTISAMAGSGGTVTPTTAAVGPGGSQTFTITPNTSYNIAFVLVDGVSQGAITSYTFTNVAATHTISAAFTTNASPSSSSVNYFYDDLGRLTRAVTDTAGAIYQYDELGNLLSAMTATTTTGSPLISGINPNILFIGSSPQLVSITGQNLLATESVTSSKGLVAINKVTVNDTQITVEMTPLSTGIDTIRVTSRNGTPNTAEITIPVSTLVLSPGQLAITPGTSGTVTAVVFPPPPTPITFSLNISDPSIASIPQSVTIPVSGSAGIAVNALQLGDTTISCGEKRAVVFVANPFVWDVGETVLGSSANVSVMINSSLGTSPINASSVSVAVDAPYSSSAEAAAPVSVIIDAPLGNSPTVSSVSVAVDAPLGNSPTVSGGVSVKIQ